MNSMNSNTTCICKECNYYTKLTYHCKSQWNCIIEKHMNTRRHKRIMEIYKKNNITNKYSMTSKSPDHGSSSDDEYTEDEDIASLPSVVTMENQPEKESLDDNLPLDVRKQRVHERHDACREYSYKWGKVPFRIRCPSYYEEDENGKLQPLYPCDLVRCYENGWFDKNDRYGTVLMVLLESAGISV